MPYGTPSAVVVESMRTYDRMKGGPPPTSIALAAVGGAVLGAFPDALPLAFLAARWKGQVPRDIMGARVEMHLRDGKLPPGVIARLDVVAKGSKTHRNDALHAVGLGLYTIERAASLGIYLPVKKNGPDPA